MDLERRIVTAFKTDPVMKIAILGFIYRAPPPAPQSLVDCWYLCRKVADDFKITEKEIFDNVEAEKITFGPISLTHTCDALCEKRTQFNAVEQDRLKAEITKFGYNYKGSSRRLLEKLAEVFPIKFR